MAVTLCCPRVSTLQIRKFPIGTPIPQKANGCTDIVRKLTLPLCPKRTDPTAPSTVIASILNLEVACCARSIIVPFVKFKIGVSDTALIKRRFSTRPSPCKSRSSLCTMDRLTLFAKAIQKTWTRADDKANLNFIVAKCIREIG